MTEPYRIEEELLGPTPRRIVQSESGRGAVVGPGCLSLLLFPFIAAALWMLYQSTGETLVAHAGVNMPGRVTSRSIDTSSDGDSYKIAFTYRYDGHDYSNSTDVSEEDYRKLENGEPVTVQALSYAPSITPALLDPCGCDGQPRAFDWGFTLFWNAFTWLVVWIIVGLFVTSRGLIIHGEPAAARVTHKDSETSDGSTTYRVHYEFTPAPAPLTTVQGEQNVAKKQWDAIESGDRMTVLYYKHQPVTNTLYQFSSYRVARESDRIQTKRY